MNRSEVILCHWVERSKGQKVKRSKGQELSLNCNGVKMKVEVQAVLEKNRNSIGTTCPAHLFDFLTEGTRNF